MPLRFPIPEQESESERREGPQPRSQSWNWPEEGFQARASQVAPGGVASSIVWIPEPREVCRRHWVMGSLLSRTAPLSQEGSLICAPLKATRETGGTPGSLLSTPAFPQGLETPRSAPSLSLENANEQRLTQTRPSGCFPAPPQRGPAVTQREGEGRRRARGVCGGGRRARRETSFRALPRDPPSRLGASPHLAPKCVCVPARAHTYRDPCEHTSTCVCKACLWHTHVRGWSLDLA